ncbi:MAG: SOS-response cell division inhibitor [Pseudomonadota bacterium]
MKFQHITKHYHPGLWQGSVASPQERSQQPVDDYSSVQQVLACCVNCPTERWITVVGGQREFIAQLLAAGVASQRVRWLRTNDPQQRQWAVEQAMLSGTSSVVVGWLDDIEPRFNQRIKMACRLSHTKSFLFEENTLLTHLH